MPIVTKEQLKSHLHSIHDYIRNSGAGYGMHAMKTFMFIYGLKVIEPMQKDLGLKNMTKFSELVSFAHSNNGLHIIEAFKNNEDGTGILYDIYTSKLKDILYYHIPLDLNEDFYKKIIIMIDEIPINRKTIDNETNNMYDVDLTGKLYEYFIGRDQTAISELGAYFSDRHITTFCIEDMKPELDNDTMPLCIDPFGGSGGFLLNFVGHMNKKYKLDNKFWKKNHTNINHYDMNNDVIQVSALEMYRLTGELPDMKNNFKRTNSFKSDYFGKKFKYIMSNPPYGGDSNKGSVLINDYNNLIEDLKSTYYVYDNKTEKYAWTEKWAKIQYEEDSKKLKEIHNELETRKVNYNTASQRIKHFVRDYDDRIKCDRKLNEDEKKQYILVKKNNDSVLNDKESVSLILFMDLLDENGTCSVILKEGVFFDNKYSRIRKCLIDNYNVYKIVSIESDQFENTTTKTSILFFKNNGRTQKVQFSKLVVNKEEKTIYENKETDGKMRRHCVKSEGNIIDVVEVPITTATYDEISAPIVTKNKKGEDIIKYHYTLNAKQYRNTELKCNDKYELVPLGNKCEFQNGYAFKPTNYVKTGIPIITIKNIPLFNIDKCNYYTEYDDYKAYEIKYDDIIISLTGGKTDICNIGIYKNKSKAYLNQRTAIIKNYTIDKNYLIALFNIWIIYEIDKTACGTIQQNISTNTLKTIKIPIPHSQTLLNKWVEKISTPYDAIQQKKQKLAVLEEKVKLEVKRIGDDEKCDMMALSEVCKDDKNNICINSGKPIKKSDRNGNKYPYYTSNGICGFMDSYLFDGEYIIIAQDGTIGATYYIKEKFYASNHTWIIKIPKHNIKYCYYILKYFINYELYTHGSVIIKLNLEELKSIKIPIPRNATLISNLEKDFKKIETLQQEIKDNETQYNQVLKELSDDIKLETITKDITKDTINSDKPQIKNKNNYVAETKHIISDEPQTKKKTKKVIKEEYNSDNERKTTHIVSDEPTIKKKTKKIVKKEYNLDDEQDIKHIVSVEPAIKKKTKKVIKEEYNSDNERETKHIVSDEPRTKKKTKKVIKEEYNSDDNDQNTSDNPLIKKKIKKVVKNKYNSDDDEQYTKKHNI